MLICSFFSTSDCPGPQSESAGKSDACEGCPNQEACATAPKGPDPGSYLFSFVDLSGFYTSFLMKLPFIPFCYGYVRMDMFGDQTMLFEIKCV